VSTALAALDAVVAALAADSGVRTFTGGTDDDPRVYTGALAPKGTAVEDDDGNPTPYLVVGDPSEGDVGFFRGGAFDDGFRVRTWTPGGDLRAPLVGYAHVRRVLTAGGLTLDGASAWRCDVLLERVLADADGLATQAIAGVQIVAVPNG
jgi:hypothetical protein